jgi:hypothetical protein
MHYRVVTIVVILLIALGAGLYAIHSQASKPSVLMREIVVNTRKNNIQPSRHATIKAVYLVKAPGNLDQRDLNSHPDLIVTESFDEFKEYAKWRVALWVDKNMDHLIDNEKHWFASAPQAYYPLVVVGYGDRYMAFRIYIPMCCFPKSSLSGWDMGMDYSGFSVYQKDPNQEEPNVWEGYTYKPTAQQLLNITNRLLNDTE